MRRDPRISAGGPARSRRRTGPQRSQPVAISKSYAFRNPNTHSHPNPDPVADPHADDSSHIDAESQRECECDSHRAAQHRSKHQP